MVDRLKNAVNHYSNRVTAALAKKKYNEDGYDPEKDMYYSGAMAVLTENRRAHLVRAKGVDNLDVSYAEAKKAAEKVLADEYARLKKEDNVAVREDSGARPSDLTKKYNNEMAHGKDVNVLAPEPLKETIVENTRAVLTGDQPMVFDKEIAGKLFEYVNGRPASHLDLLKMRVNAENSEKMYAAHGSSVSRVTAEVNKAVRDLAQPKQKDTNYVARAQDAARGK
jgi:hypothetical protein